MSKQSKPDDMIGVLEEYYMLEARMKPIVDQPSALFKLTSKPKLRMEDEQGRFFDIDEEEVRPYFSKINLNTIKWINIRQYEFDANFDINKGLVSCVSIVMGSTDFELIGDKDRHEFKACLLRTQIMPEPISLANLTWSLKGYLNRIGKRAFVRQVDMPFFDVYTLSDYIPQSSQPLDQLGQIQRKKEEDYYNKMNINQNTFLTQLNAQGTKVLGKISKTLKRGDLFNHIIRMELKNPIVLHQISKVLITPESIKEDAVEPKRVII